VTDHQQIGGEFYLEPFGRLQTEQFSWDGEVRLPAWSDFRFRRAYAGGTIRDDEAGLFHLGVDRPNTTIADGPSPAQVQAFEYTVRNQVALREAMLAALFKGYPGWHDVYSDAGVSEEVMPRVFDAAASLVLVGPDAIFVMDVEHDGLAYVGYTFGCAWEEEYGIGFMTLGSQIVDAGFGYVAFQAYAGSTAANASAFFYDQPD
jgi:hypothetical protein